MVTGEDSSGLGTDATSSRGLLLAGDITHLRFTIGPLTVHAREERQGNDYPENPERKESSQCPEDDPRSLGQLKTAWFYLSGHHDSLPLDNC